MYSFIANKMKTSKNHLLFCIKRQFSSQIINQKFEIRPKRQLQNQKQYQKAYEDIQDIQKLKKLLIQQKKKPTELYLHLKLAKLFKQLNLKEESFYHINYAFKLNQKNIQAMQQYVQSQILINQLQQAQTILKQLRQISQTQNKTTQNIQYLQKMLTHKQRALKDCYQYSQDWIKALTLRNLQFQHFSPQLCIRKSKNGLGLFALNDIPKHQIIIAERPFMFISQRQKKKYYAFKTKEDIRRLENFVIKKYKSLVNISRTFEYKFLTLSNSKNCNLQVLQRKKMKNISLKQICQRIKQNAYQVEDLTKMVSGDQDKQVTGDGLYQFINYINHSCCFNVQRYFIGDYNIIRTVENIKKDEQICGQYFSSFKLSIEERKKQSLRRFNFSCNCSYCSEGKCDQRFLELIQSYQRQPDNIDLRDNIKINANYRLLDAACRKNDSKLIGQLLNIIFKCNREQQFVSWVQNNRKVRSINQQK